MNKKINLWPLLFISIFGFALYMIGWTIYNSSHADFASDDSFMQKYHDVDEKYNEIVIQSEKFRSKYKLDMVSNSKNISLDFADMKLRQVAKNKEHADLFVSGKNQISISIVDLNQKVVENAKIKAIFSSSTSDDQKQIIENFVFRDGKYFAIINVAQFGNFNFTGEVTVGEDKAYFFIKTNAVSK